MLELCVVSFYRNYKEERATYLRIWFINMLRIGNNQTSNHQSLQNFYPWVQSERALKCNFVWLNLNHMNVKQSRVKALPPYKCAPEHQIHSANALPNRSLRQSERVRTLPLKLVLGPAVPLALPANCVEPDCKLRIHAQISARGTVRWCVTFIFNQ